MTKAARGEERGKVRLRFVEFELEGLSSTIEESIKSIVASMNRGNAGALPAQQRGNGSPHLPRLVALNGNDGSEPAGPEKLDEDIGPGGSQGDESAPTRTKGATRYTQPHFLKELDLDSGEKPFKDYANDLHPETDNDRYLVIASWLKLFRSLDSITIHHVYTCNQKMGWTSQKDVGQPFRQLKRKSMFINSRKGQWEITHIGLDRARSGITNSD